MSLVSKLNLPLFLLVIVASVLDDSNTRPSELVAPDTLFVKDIRVATPTLSCTWNLFTGVSIPTARRLPIDVLPPTYRSLLSETSSLTNKRPFNDRSSATIKV